MLSVILKNIRMLSNSLNLQKILIYSAEIEIVHQIKDLEQLAT